MHAKKKHKPGKFEKKVLNRPDWDVDEQWIIDNEQLTIEDRAAPGSVQNSTHGRSMTNEQCLAQLDELMEDPSMWRKPRKGRPLRPDEPEPRWLVQARRIMPQEHGSAYATIKPGQWERHYNCQYSVWVHRLARAVGKEIDQLPEKAPSLPWPVEKKPINELRTYNSGLFPKFPVKPKRRPHLCRSGGAGGWGSGAGEKPKTGAEEAAGEKLLATGYWLLSTVYFLKYRDPVNPKRKRSWRQNLRSHIVLGPGLLTWLTRNPISNWNSSRWTDHHRRHKTLDLGPISPDALRNAGRQTGPRPQLTELFPNAALPKHYVELVDRRWLTEDGNLFAATPGGDFATTIEGFPLRLPVAVMPPESYERWRARGGHQPRKRRRARGSLRRRKKAGCTCYFMRRIRPPFPNGAKVKSGFS